MNAFETWWHPLIAATQNLLVEESKPLIEIRNTFLATAAKAKDAIKQIEETGVKIDLNTIFDDIPQDEDSKKENVSPAEIPEEAPSGRPRRNAFKTATSSIKKQANVNLTTKLRQSAAKQTPVKTEKMSLVDASSVQIKEETDALMPAPTRPAPKKTKKAPKPKIKEEKIDEPVRRSTRTRKQSEVVVVETPVPVIELTDSDSESLHQTDEEVETPRLDKTVTVNQQPSNLNVTVLIEKSTIPQDLLTDDESIEEPVKSPSKTITAKITQMFSPYENSPVKKRVEAFEKLATLKIHSETTKLPIRERSKMTPDKFQPKMASTAKLSKFLPGVSHNNSNFLDSTQKQDAVKKRDAMMSAISEEKKRKREEKQLKVQQQREAALEKERLKALEAQRLKEERHKQLRAEQEERKNKLKSEMEKKRHLAKIKAIEEKKREEEQRAPKTQRVAEDQYKKVPTYMSTKAPLLPSDDCYDSDEDQSNAKYQSPKWARSDELKKQLLTIVKAQDQIKNSFFCRQADTADLQEIFEVISAKKLKRSSSAIWHKAPRFTMMPILKED